MAINKALLLVLNKFVLIGTLKVLETSDIKQLSGDPR